MYANQPLRHPGFFYSNKTQLSTSSCFKAHGQKSASQPPVPSFPFTFLHATNPSQGTLQMFMSCTTPPATYTAAYIVSSCCTASAWPACCTAAGGSTFCSTAPASSTTAAVAAAAVQPVLPHQQYTGKGGPSYSPAVQYVWWPRCCVEPPAKLYGHHCLKRYHLQGHETAGADNNRQTSA